MISIRAFHTKQVENSLTLDSQGEVLEEWSDEDILENEFRKKRLQIPAETAFALLYLLQTNHAYRHIFFQYLRKKVSSDKNLLLNLQMIESKNKLDSLGNKMASILLWEFIELEDALHWLSTLGGAFSNLGEHDQMFAKRAGENAMKQLIVAHKFGDQIVIAKCWLFVAMSLMQQQYFHNAQLIVRNVYGHCRDKRMKDLAGTGKLVASCRGIWARLKYEASRGTERGLQSENIEVEFKFCPPEDIVNKLQVLGAHEMKTRTMVDIYVDTKDLELIKKDCWLRYRNGKIELKIPLESYQHISKSTIYREITCAKKIKHLLGYDLPTNTDSLPEGWIVLAKVETTRQTWIWDGFTFVLDSLPDGFQIGEVELTPSSSQIKSVEAATKSLNKLANQLGLIKQLEGKLNHCLRTQNPEGYRILTERLDSYSNQKR